MWGSNGPAVRLGFRRIKGMQEAHANVVADIRKHCGRFTSVEQVHRLTGLPVDVVERFRGKVPVQVFAKELLHETGHGSAYSRR